MTDAEHKRIRTRKSHTPAKLGRPTKTAKTEQLKNLPQNVPIEEHRYMLWLAKLWEDHHAAIELLQTKQRDLQIAAHEFSSTYCEEKATPKI